MTRGVKNSDSQESAVRQASSEAGRSPAGEPGRKGRARRYDSTRRREQARETRQRILDGAGRLFVARGYAGATMEAVAREAGVAVETAYAAYRSKRALLEALVKVLVRGDDAAAPLLESPGPQGVRRAPDQRQQIRLFAGYITGILGRISPLLEVIRCASHAEPGIARLLRGMMQVRMENLTQFVEWVAAKGPLREGVDVAEAAETVWTLASGET
jgi:TetR/AcrR family transcriptional regulator of autoinduction and epiphytic fitness